MPDQPVYDDAVIIAADAPAHVTQALGDAGYRILLVTARHAVHVRSTEPAPRPGTPRHGGKRGITVTEAAGLLGISRSAAYAMAHTGALPSIRLGRRIVVPETAIEGLLDARPPLAAS